MSFVTILRRRIVAMGWQVFNEQARKLKVTRLTGLVDGFIKMFSAPHHSVDKQYVVFLAIHARAPSALARGEELLTFNMLLDDLIAQEKRQGAIDPQVRTDVVREIVFGAFFELAYMLYVKDVGIARGTVAYSWSDVRAAMMRIIACFGPAQWGDAAARTVTDGG